MPLSWDDALEKKLLLNIIDLVVQPGTSIPWTELANRIGPEATEKACQRKLQNLKAAVKAEFGFAANGDAPKTPAAKKGAKKANGESVKKSTGKRKKVEVDADGGSGDDEEVSPSKKVKDEQEYEVVV